MNPPSMESIFLILSGAILAAGVLYWFWSHIQLTQKKVQLLENAIFELRGMLSSRDPLLTPELPPAPAPAPASTSEPVYADLADDEDDWDQAPSPSPSQPIASTPLEALHNDNPDLQPGGRIEVPSATSQAEQFRELFIQHEKVDKVEKVDKDKSDSSESLEAMPVRELRRLAEQRGLTGVSDMKKKELLASLRQTVPSPAKHEVSVERTLDLTVGEDAPVLE